jgi:hypothetical protein
MVHSLKKKTTVEKYRCRKCGISKIGDDFYKSTEPDLDSNGRMSICKLCVKGIVDTFIASEGSVEHGFLKTCKKLNILYDSVSVEKTIAKTEEMKNDNKLTEMIFGIYLRQLFAVYPSNSDLQFKESEEPIVVTSVDEKTEEIDPIMVKLEDEWGKGLESDDYVFLENELARWESTHRSDTMAEKTLLRHIAYKQFEIRRARQQNPNDTDLSTSLIKQLQDLLKTASIDPGKANASGQGKGMESFSAFIKMIETTEPAEYYSDKDLFKDVDNIGFYFEKYVTRPLKNFVMGSRDFNVETEQEGDDEDDSFDISDMGIDDDVPVINKEEIKKEE